MNSRQRFLETMRFGSPDRVPLFNEGIRSDVLAAWQAQGFPKGKSLAELFPYDHREELAIDFVTGLNLARLKPSAEGLKDLQSKLESKSVHRMPFGWPEQLESWQNRQHCLMLQVHDGLFLSLGVGEWRSFADAIYFLTDHPGFVRDALVLIGEFAAILIDELLEALEVDAILFSEPIGGPHGPLISPRMYGEIVLPGYAPIVNIVRKHGIDLIIWRTYANTELLLPPVVDAGINGLWAVERGPEAMNYSAIRSTYDTELGLIGGIDLDVLVAGKRAIEHELSTKLPALLASGGFIPLADGRVRGDISLEAYTHYRQLLAALTSGG